MDPFTQKYVERAKARKEYLDAQFAKLPKLPQAAPRKRRSPLKEENSSTDDAEIQERNQKSDDDSVGKRQCLELQHKTEQRRESRGRESKENVPKITSQTKRSLKALARLHSNNAEFEDQDDEEEPSPPQSRISNKLNSPVDIPVPKDRINRLAALAKSINKWEDDLPQGHSVTKSCIKSKTDSSPKKSSSPPSERTSLSPTKRVTVAAYASSPSGTAPKLQSDAHKSPAKDGPSCGKVGRSSSTASSSASSASPKRRSSSFSTASPPHSNKRPSQKNSPSGGPQQSSKRVVWDQAIVATLQAQGFVQSPSKSKLEYNFRKTRKSTEEKSHTNVETESESESESSSEEESASTSAHLHESFKTPPKPAAEPAKKSVKELARKFTGPPPTPVKQPQRDPAELPLSARVALFEKEAANASNSNKHPAQKRLVSRMSFNEKLNSCYVPPGTTLPDSPAASPVKKIAKMSPAKETNKSSAKKENKSSGSRDNNPSLSPSKVGKHTFQLHRQLFEHLSDDWKENEISAKIREERQKDMDVVLNRWSHKSKEAALAATSSVHGEGRFPAAASVSAPAVTKTAAPDKPKVQAVKSIPPPPPLPGHANVVVRQSMAVPSASAACDDDFSSDDEVDVAPAQYLCESDLTDDVASDSSEPDEDAQRAIRTLDEAIPEVETGDSSDYEEHYDVDDDFEDVGDDNVLDSSILQEAFTRVSPLKNPEPKPPRAPVVKLSPARQVQPAAPTPYVNYNQRAEDETRGMEAPLLHTVSFYRRQKDTVRLTPVRTVVRHHELVASPPEASRHMESSPRCSEQTRTIAEQIKDLQEEVNREQVVVSQSSQALILCRSTSEFHGSAEQIEGEKLLLIASQRLTACLNEIKRLKTEGAMGTLVAPASTGSLSISDIRLPLRKAFLEETSNGRKGEFVSFFLCLVKFRSLVIATQMVSTHDCISNGGFSLPNLINIRDLNRDFNVVVEVYGLQTERENVTKQQRTLPSKKEKSRLTLTPKKRQSKRDLRMASPAVHGNSGATATCTSSFDIVGFATINLKTLQRKSWTLEKCPHNSPLEGNILMKVQCHTDVSTSEEQGFLTMFEDIGGFGAWHRRWFNLSTRYVSYWKYPDDVKRKDPIGIIDLCKCVTPEVGLVPRDICARPHTFMLLTVKPRSQNEENTLVSQSYSSYTINKILLSADTKEERISWCHHLNRAIDNVRSWDPEALQPIPSDSTASK